MAFDVGQFFLFRGIGEPSFLKSLNSLPIRTFPKGMVILQKGDLGQEVYGVLEGEVEVLNKNGDGDWSRVGVLGPGNVFGEFSYLTGNPRSYPLIALSAVTAFEMSPVWIEKISKEYPSIQEHLLDIYRSRVLYNSLRSSSLFRHVSPADLNWLMSEFVHRKFQKGSAVLKEGEIGKDLYLVKKGRIQILASLGTKMTEVGEVGPGEILGEMAMITGDRRIAAAIARDDVEVMTLSQKSFLDLLSRNPKTLDELRHVIESRSETTRGALEKVSTAIENRVSNMNSDVWIHMDDLKIGVSYEFGGLTGMAQLMMASRIRWVLEMRFEASGIRPGLPVVLMPTKTVSRDLRRFLKADSFHGHIEKFEASRLIVRLQDFGLQKHRTRDFMIALARAKVRALAYPDYSIEDQNLFLTFTRREKTNALPIKRLSMTHALVEGAVNWDPGEVYPIQIQKAGIDSIFHGKGVCLNSHEGEYEIQLDYDSKESKECLIELLPEYRKSELNLLENTQNRFLYELRDQHPQEFLNQNIFLMDEKQILLPTNRVVPLHQEICLRFSFTSLGEIFSIDFIGRIVEMDKTSMKLQLRHSSNEILQKVQVLMKKVLEGASEDIWFERKQKLLEPT